MSDAPKYPKLLYKYRDWDADGHADAMIRCGEVYFATVQSLNDPFEFRWLDKFPLDEWKADQFLREQIARANPLDTVEERAVRYSALRRQVDDHFQKFGRGTSPTMVKDFDFGVFCCAELPRDLLMWAHYANSHTGVCIGFSPDVLMPARMFPVIYSDEVPVFDVWDYFRDSQDKFVTIGRTKGLAWKYELEWRTIGDIGAARYPNFARRVVIGARAPDATIAAVVAAVESVTHPIEVFHARLSNGRYGVELRQFK